MRLLLRIETRSQDWQMAASQLVSLVSQKMNCDLDHETLILKETVIWILNDYSVKIRTIPINTI